MWQPRLDSASSGSAVTSPTPPSSMRWPGIIGKPSPCMASSGRRPWSSQMAPRLTCGSPSRRLKTASWRCSTAWSRSPRPSREFWRSSVLTNLNRTVRVVSRHPELSLRAEQQAMTDLENQTVPVGTYDSWRTWLMTGARRTPVDPRRMRGAHKGLKKILVEGLLNSAEAPYTWKDFSGAMVRHAVDDAMRALPPEDTQVVKLAYFGGYSNREIAREVGLTEGTVQRRLRRALAAISDHIQHGRAIGRRVLYGAGLILSGKWLHDAGQHALTATAVVGAATVIIATQPGAGPFSDASRTSPRHESAPARTVVPPVPSPTAAVGGPTPAIAQVTVPPVPLPAVPLPVT